MPDKDKFDPMSLVGVAPKSGATKEFDPMSLVGVTPEKKNLNQSGTELSGVKSLSDTKEEEGMFSKVLMYIPRMLKGVPEGIWNATTNTGIEMARELAVNLMPDKFFAPKKMSFEEKLKAYDTSFAPMLENQKVQIKGDANVFTKEGVSMPDPEAFGAMIGEQLLQLQRNTNVGGMILNHLSATESNYEEARQKGIDPQKAYLMSHALGLTETLIDKYSGIDGRVEKFVAGKLGKIASDEAIDQIVKLGIKSEAFDEAVKTSGGFLKNLLTKGVAPEFISEGVQQVVTTGEKQLFDIYQKATKQANEGDKKGLYGADVFSMETLRDAANSAFTGGLIGGLGYTFTSSGDFNPTIYATLQREYNEKGKDGLGNAIENVKTGITKASEAGKLTPEQYNAALQNVDKIAKNVSSFEQNSKIDSYSRYSLYNVEDNLIPMVSNGLAKDLAQMAVPVEMPTTQQIDDDVTQKNLTTVSFDHVSDIPDSYRNFAAVAEDENGNKVIQFQVPNSIVKAHTDNQMAVQTLMNNPLFAIKALTDNNRLVTIEDLEKVGLGGGEVFPSSANQLQFKVKFEQNRPQLINGLKTINYLKSVSTQVKETGKAPDPALFNKGINNITKFNTGDTVFFNDKAHKILGTSPDGQKLNLSGVKEQVNASDENIKTQKEVDEIAAEPTVATTETPTAQAEPTQVQSEITAPIGEEQPIEPSQKTIGDAVYELTPFVYQGKTGRLRQLANGTVMFEAKDVDYELGNIADIGNKTLAEWDIVQQEMATDKNFTVTIDGKQFINKNQNPFAAITYDENGNPVSVKLQDEKGKTKVIKGTRALLIDAQYKERKLLNESTDEQLNEIEQQIAARTENIGNAEPTTAGGEVKPIEPAFTEKQRERQRTIDDVAKRLAPESDNSKNTKEAIANVVSSLFKAGINVEVLTTQQIKDKYNTDANQGFFLSKNGVVVINQNMIENEWGKTVVFHEGTHPIINIIRNTDPKTYKQLVAAIRDMRSSNTTIDSIIKSIEANPSYKGQFTQNDEIVVETIAMIASGKLKLSDVPLTLSQKLKNLINKIGRMLGFKQVLRDNNDVAFVRLANQISEVLNAGRDISEIVGEGNLSNYKLDVTTVQNRTLDTEKLSPVSVSKNGHELSFVKQDDLIDIVSLVNEIVDKNQKVWFWVADQLGRGYYFDEKVGEDHFLDAGISFALDPENRKNGVIWASGVKNIALQNNINGSDYIFIVSGSPQRSKLFNKTVFGLLSNRNKDFNKFKRDILAVSKISEINNILQKFDSWEGLTNSPLRKSLLIAFKEQEKKNTELKKVLESKGAILDVESIRDGFLKDNGFDINDIMLVLKPTGLGGKSNHSTYETDILGEVIGVPDKRINAFDILPDELRGENANELTEPQKTAKIAPYGSGIRSLEGIQQSDIDRAYTMESTVADAGMTMAEKEAWQEKNRVSQRQERNPAVQKGVEMLRDGLITLDRYVDIVRANMPIYSMPTVPKIPTFKEIVGALNKQALDKGGIVGLNKSFKDGERVASRLDIPAYNYFNTWVVSIHEGINNIKNGKILGYAQTAVLKNIVFVTDSSAAMNIAIDKGKVTVARIYGDWVNESPESAHKRATELMNDPEWTQVGMNPYRHSFFYDKSTGEALIGADEVIQVGALVLAKNVKRAPFGSQAFNDHFTFTNKLGQEVQFSELSRDDARINSLRNEYYNNDVTPDVLIEAAKKEYGLDQAAAEMLVSKAIGSVLDLKPYESGNKAELSDEQMPDKVKSILNQYGKGYEKDKADKLNKESKKSSFADYAVKLYDSKFKIRRILQSLSDVQTLSSARLRNIMGKAKASSMEAQQAIAEIYGGLGEMQIKSLDELIFALRVIQLDKNNSEKVYQEYDRLRKQFIKDNNGKLPNDKDLERLMEAARKSVPEINHGLVDDRLLYTAKTAQNLIDAFREAYSTEDFDNLMTRAAAYKRVGNESIAKMEQAGLLSKEVAEKYKDDFYTFRKTLERYYDDYSSNVPIYYKDGVAYYSAFKSLGEGSKESYFQRDSRVLLAENILIVNKAIAKNDLRVSIFNDIMSNPVDFFENPNSKQSVIRDKNGADLSFAFKPAVYKRGQDGNVKKEASGYVVEPASEGFVNVPFRVDGKLQYFQMEKELYDEVEGLNAVFNPQDSGVIAMGYYNVSNVANTILTASQTRYNPFFFWRNMSMDIRHQVHFTDYWTSDKNFLKSNVYSAYGRLLFQSIKNTKKIIANDEDMLNLLDEATKVGLFMDTYSEAREQVKRSSEISKESILPNKKSRWETVKDKVGMMNVKTEIAMRISAYEQAKKHLTEQYKKLHNLTDLNDAQVAEINEIASAQARGYTDFAQKGIYTPHLNYAYLNASIQGLGSALEYSYDNPAKTLRKTSELFIGHMMWTTMLMMAIPDLYDELDEYTKDIYMLSPMGFMKEKLLDSLGIPSFFIPTSKIDPTLVPIMGVARRTAEHFVREMRGEKNEPMTYEETVRLINIALPSIFNLPEKTAPVDALKDWGSKILSGSALLGSGTKLFFGYDAFRGHYVDSKGYQASSNLLDGMHNPDIPYIYKIFAKAAALATEDPNNQVSPARINAAAESIIGSPKSSFLTGMLTAVTSDIANLIIPASEIEKSDISLFNPKTIMRSFGVLTDSGLKERLQNKKFLDESNKLNLKAADIETIADKNIDLFYKQNPATFMNRVEKYAQEWDYAGDEEATERLMKKAELKFDKLEKKSGIPKDISTEVKIIYYTKGSDNQAKMLKSIAGEDKRMANKILESLSGFGMDEGKIIEIEEKYYKK